MPGSRSLNNIDVKRFNKSRIYRTIAEGGKISQLEIANKLQVSVPTVVQNVRELIESGLVREAGAFESTGGRKAKALALIPDAKFSLGLDITDAYVGLVTVDLAGNITRWAHVSATFSCSDAYFSTLGAILERFIEREEIDREKILGVGVSIPGIVNRDGSQIDFSHILGFADLPSDRISRHIPYPIAFINDANAAGFAEFRLRRDIHNAVFLSLNFGVGGSILLSDELYLGDNQRSGEFGHNTVVPGGRPCYCGKEGCLDAYCSSRILSSHADDSLETFFRRLDGGDADLAEIWDEYLYYLAVAVNNLRMTFDCDVIVGGTVGPFLEGRSDPLRRRLVEFNTFEPDGDYFKICHYKHEASAAGAALTHVAAFEDNL